jgi:hypothetical protein
MMASTSQTTADALIHQAHLATGLPVRGEASFRPGLERFLQARSGARTITTHGQANIDGFILQALVARLRMEDWIERHPDVLDKPVERPAFIVGQPRAGTTLLLNLLALDDQRRVYWNWETLQEIPPARAGHLHDDPRIAPKVAQVEAAIRSGLLDPRLHVEMGNDPSECTFLLGQDFKSNLWYSQTPVPDYFEWLYEGGADMVAAYRYQRRALQVLQSGAPGKWTLKLPSHAPFLDALLAVFPDARIVMTHRDPAKTIPSSCKSTLHFMAMSNAGVDPAYIGRETLRVIETSVMRPAAIRKKHPLVPFYDFHYRNFSADPVAEIRRIYAFLGDELTASTQQRMNSALNEHVKRRQVVGPNICRLEDYGLDRAGIDQMFGAYMREYGVQRE